MTSSSRLIVIGVLFYSCSGTSASNLAGESCDHFSYGDDQVSEWNRCWPNCDGDNQSPVNIDTQDVITESLPPLDGSFIHERNSYHRFAFINDVFTLTLRPIKPDDLYLEGGPLVGRYFMQALQFSWGSDLSETVGSEHAIDGKRYPLEAQWTFYNEKYSGIDEVLKHKDGIMMISILFPYNDWKEGNDMISQLAEPIGYVNGFKLHFDIVNYGPLFPAHSINDYYSYNGSLTKPLCSENVIWLVYLQDDGVDLRQLNTFWSLRNRADMVENNFRPLQPLNCRQVVQSDKSSRVTDESTEGRQPGCSVARQQTSRCGDVPAAWSSKTCWPIRASPLARSVYPSTEHCESAAHCD